MKKIVLLLTFAAAVALTPLSSGSTAATVQISITRVGFVPANVTVNTGDTFLGAGHFMSTRAKLTKSTGQLIASTRTYATFSFTYSKAGRFRFEDPLVSPRQRGSVTVRAANTVTLAANPTIVRYGRSTVLSGKISEARANETVSIFVDRCRDTAFSKIGEAKTESNGTWTFGTKPLDRSSYRATWGNANSDPALVRTRPRITLAKLAPHRYRVRVFAAQSFAGNSISFQRWNATRRIWVNVRSVVLADTGLGVDPTEISGRDFRSSISAGKRVRMRMGSTVAGTCYLGNTSNVIVS